MFERTESVANTGSEVLEVHLEPWGCIHLLQPRQVLRVVARGADDGDFEVVRTPDTVTVFAWPGTTAKAFEGGVLVQDLSTPVPEVPHGMSMRSFVATMFGAGEKS